MSHTDPGLRPPDVVMRLARMGAAYPTRLSFMRTLMRRMNRERWSIGRRLWAMDADGIGEAVYGVETPFGPFSLVAFTRPLGAAERTDRVIAERWDASFALHAGIADRAALDRLAANVPLQEAGRFTADELVLSRANRGVRLFDHVAERLGAGQQPERARLAEVGYLMRTTAVYGNGKFGLADRARLHDGPVLELPFQAEMLTVYLIRQFTFDLVEHVARSLGGVHAAPLDRVLKRSLGIGNATGLGMAPFLVGHPRLINQWFLARETAIARVRALPRAEPGRLARFAAVLERARRHVDQWSTGDARLAVRLEHLRAELALLASGLGANGTALSRRARPWAWLMDSVGEGSLELQELVASLALEPHGDLIDDLEATTKTDEDETTDPGMSVACLARAIEDAYGWALGIDFETRESQHLFWYASQDKIEPRLGERWEEPGAELEARIGVARDVQALHRDATAAALTAPAISVAEFLMDRPHHRHWVKRVHSLVGLPYAEIRDNLLARDCMPIDILRCKLAFFGAAKFDPKSDRWVRITLFQGAPLADELASEDGDDWAFPVVPG